MTFRRIIPRFFILLPCVLALTVHAASEEQVLKQLKLLNQVPQEELNDKTDPGFSILRTLYDQDGPDFLTLRKMLGKADVRSRLNPSVKCLMAGVMSQRWDTFTLTGNLYLSGLTSPNPDLRDKARRKLVCFIQPAHLPALIELLKVPGPNVLAYEILQEVTGLRIEPKMKLWQKWWLKRGAKFDLVGHLISDTRTQLHNRRVHAFDQERFWYMPEGIKDSQTPYEKRSEKEQAMISAWNSWVNADVRRTVDDWTANKPLLDRLVHQPDPRVNQYLKALMTDAGYGDYASVLLAWRSHATALSAMKMAFKSKPTVGRALARGSLGDRTALVDLLQIIDQHQTEPLTYKIMDDDARGMMTTLRTVGIIPAEQAFELLCHHHFEFDSAFTAREKKKAFKSAKSWLQDNAKHLSLDRRRGYYVLDNEKK